MENENAPEMIARNNLLEEVNTKLTMLFTLLTNNKQPQNADAGVKKTEMWMCGLAMVCATILCGMGILSAAQWTAAVPTIAGLYTYSRTRVKIEEAKNHNGK